MNCENCLNKCKVACCGIIPFDKKFIEKNKPIREVKRVNDLGDGNVILETKGLKCPYLNDNFSCSIYDKRPDVCRLYGNETQINLTCQFQDKNGRIRGRQERRQIEREICKCFDKFVREHK